MTWWETEGGREGGREGREGGRGEDGGEGGREGGEEGGRGEKGREEGRREGREGTPLLVVFPHKRKVDTWDYISSHALRRGGVGGGTMPSACLSSLAEL